jgi:hypothetical protein
MKNESTNIISRIAWCRLQQQLRSVTREERAGWPAEEAGLMDALGFRDRTACMREEHRSHFMRYQCGLEDGKALLRLSILFSSGMTRTKGQGQARSMTVARVDRRPSQAPPPMHVGEFRR